jgi:hypothetical protein
MRRFIGRSTLLAVSVLLVSCAAAPTRENEKAFKLVQEGSIRPSEAGQFADCVLDGFDKAHFMLTNITSRQQRRADSYRIESFSAGRMLLMSADVFDDGKARLLESTTAALINTTGEREAFAACLSKFSAK